MPERFSAWCYVFAWAATLADRLLGLPTAGLAAGLAVLAFLLLEFPNQRRYAQAVFLGLLGVGMAGVVLSAEPLALFLSGWRQGASYAAFFLALSSLRDAAETSPLVRRCGQHLVAQPAGRRYAALTGGGHVFGIVLSYGAIELLGAMVARANARPNPGEPEQQRVIRGRRMLMAIYRGFCVMNCWSPLNIMTAVVSTAVPGAPIRQLLPIAFAGAVGMASVGWLDDRWSGARAGSGGGAPPATNESWAIHLRIVALVLLVMLLAEAVSLGFAISLVTAVTLVVPLVGLAWVAVQTARFGAARSLGMLWRRAGRFLLRVPGFRGEATVLASSGFMAAAIGGVLPSHGIAPFLTMLPPLAVPLLVPVVLIGTGQLGLNPVAMVALLGAAMPEPAAFGVPPAALALSFMLSWGLGVGMTPMSSSAIITARWAGASPWTVSTLWNARFTLAALPLTWAMIAAVFYLWPTSFTAN
jgi:hypothetical protein